MKLVHTSDWHLGAVLKHVPRLRDQLERVEEILIICDENDVDVLLVAGDFLNETQSQRMTTVLREFGRLLRPRLQRGMHVVVLAGNHDREWVFPFLHTARDLFGDFDSSRLDFIWKPQLKVIETAKAERVRLLCLPYPRQPAYDLEAIVFKDAADRHHQLAAAVKQRINSFEAEIKKDPNRMPTVVLAHFLIAGQKANDHELTEEADVPIPRVSLPNFAYSALGHVHLPTELGTTRCRYSGSMERMDFGEIGQERQVVLVELDGTGLVGEPQPIPLHPTEFVDLAWHEGDDLVALAREVNPQAICRLRLFVPIGSNVQAVQAEARTLIDRLCWPPEIRWEGDDHDRGAAAGALVMDRADWQGTVRTYIAEMVSDDDPQRDALTAAVEELIAEEARG